METRSAKELERRLALVLAQSFQKIRFVKWDSASGNGTQTSLVVDEAGPDGLIAVLDYKGSALIKLDSMPYWSLDGYHKSFPIPTGKHVVSADFSPFLAFGERTTISPGLPVLAQRDPVAFRYWNHGVMTFELARQLKDREVSEDLYEALSRSLQDAYFEGVTHEQLVLANYLSSTEKFPQEIVTIVPESNPSLQSIGYREDVDRWKWKKAQASLDSRLQRLVKKYGKRGEMLAIAHGHIDTAWLWHFDETRKKVARTFSVVNTLMDSSEELHYVQSMALYYDWTKREQPELYKRIKDHVKTGRWEIGIGWVENDANMISGESFARQFLYSQRFYKQEFGKYASVYWLPDTFGFAGSIPQIAKLGGTKLFATQKLFWNETNTFPYSLFKWIGIDGTKLPSIYFGRGKDGYNSTFGIETILEQWNNWPDKDLDLPLLYSFGWGDGGGGPTEEMLIRAEATSKLPILPKVRLDGKSQSTSFLESNYAKLLSPDLKRNFWRGELYLERHQGVFTSHTKMKYLNRRAEFALREAELWSTILKQSSRNQESRREELEILWKTLLKNQFHDVLPGSSINQVYVTVYRELEELIARADEIANDSMRQLAGLDNDKNSGEEKTMLFNSLPWNRENEYVISSEDFTQSQHVDDGYLVKVAVPSVGYCPLDEAIISEDSIEPVKVLESGGHYLLENRFLRVRIDRADGTVTSIYDKEAAREVLKERSNVFVFYENIPGWGDAWDIEKGYKTTKFEMSEANESKIVENGPLRVKIKVRMKPFRHSTLEQEIVLHADSRRIDYKTTSNLCDRELLLKVWFHFDINSDQAVYEIPFGSIERKITTNTSWDKAKYEVPMLKWGDISEANYGVAMLNDGRYGMAAEHSSFGLSIAKSPIYPDYATDSEPSTFTFSIYPHPGRTEEGQVQRKAYELNQPLRIVRGKTAKSSIRRNTNGPKDQRSFLTIDSANLMLEAVKEAEDGDGMILRLYEMHNKRGRVTVDLWREYSNAKSTNLLEDPDSGGNLQRSGRKVRLLYRNYQILSLKLDA